MTDDFLGAMESAQQQDARRSAPIPAVSTLPIYGGRVALIDAMDQDVVNEYKWYYARGYVTSHTPMKNCVRKTVRLHRLILGARDGEIVDHINGDPLDNRRLNLRIVTPYENAQNRAGVKGCYFHKGRGKWVYKIICRGVLYTKGNFKTEADAIAAHDEKALEIKHMFRGAIYG